MEMSGGSIHRLKLAEYKPFLTGLSVLTPPRQAGSGGVTVELSDILSPDAVLTDFRPNSKKQLLQDLAQYCAPIVEVEQRRIFETLLQRERLGSTGVGNGVAIPHGKFPGIAGITCVFAKLAKPIEFDSMDDQPVDIVCLLVAPEGSGADHLKALSRVARILRDQSILAQMRASSDPETIYSLLTAPDDARAA